MPRLISVPFVMQNFVLFLKVKCVIFVQLSSPNRATDVKAFLKQISWSLHFSSLSEKSVKFTRLIWRNFLYRLFKVVLPIFFLPECVNQTSNGFRCISYELVYLFLFFFYWTISIYTACLFLRSATLGPHYILASMMYQCLHLSVLF